MKKLFSVLMLLFLIQGIFAVSNELVAVNATAVSAEGIVSAAGTAVHAIVSEPNTGYSNARYGNSYEDCYAKCKSLNYADGITCYYIDSAGEYAGSPDDGSFTASRMELAEYTFVEKKSEDFDKCVTECKQNYPPLEVQQVVSAVSVGNIAVVSSGGSTGGSYTVVPERYRYAYWQCYDGKEGKQGSESSCKSYVSWRTYAEEFCKGHCYEDGSKCGINSFGVRDECKDSSVAEDRPVSTQVVRCVPSKELLQEYERLMKKYESAQSEEEKKKIHEMISDVKEKISNQECYPVEHPVDEISAVEIVDRVKPSFVAVNMCRELDGWNEKIKYYESLLVLDEEKLKNMGFTYSEVKRILEELYAGRDKLEKECKEETSSSRVIEPGSRIVLVSCEELIRLKDDIARLEKLLKLSEEELEEEGYTVEDVKRKLEGLNEEIKGKYCEKYSDEDKEKPAVVRPVAVSAATEISSYYRDRISTAMNDESVDSQVKELKNIQKEIDKLIANLLKVKEKIEYNDLQEFGREITVRPSRIEIGDQVVEAEKEIEVEINSGRVSISNAGTGIVMQALHSGEVRVKKEVTVSEEGMRVDGRLVQVNPVAVANAIPQAEEIELDSEGEKIVYRAKVKNTRNLLFILPVQTEETATINAETGVVEAYESPWWSFLSSGEQAVSVGEVLQ